MSSVGDALSGGGSSSTGINDQTFSDAMLGDQMTGGDGTFGASSDPTFGTNAGTGGPTEFSSFSNVLNALSGGGGGGSPALSQAAALSAPGAGAPSGGDPVGAASGTQSATTPGSTNTQPSAAQTGQNQNQGGQPPDHAPASAVDELKTLLKQLSGKPLGPTGPLPSVAAGETGAQSPPPLPGLAAGQTGAQSPQGRAPLEGGIADLPAVAAGETGAQSPGSLYGTSVQPKSPGGGAIQTVAGAPPAEARVPPGAATQPGRDVTVRPPGQPTDAPAPTADAQPAPAVAQPAPGAAPPAPAETPPAVQPTRPPPRLLQDITGRSTGAPIGLPELVQMASLLLPLAGMLIGGRRGAGFKGGRFTHGIHPPGGGRAWPYHHPQFGWHMHGGHPGHGWLPLNPVDAETMLVRGGGAQPGQQNPNGLDPNRPPKETGAPVGPAGGTSSGATPGVTAKQYDDFARDYAKNIGVDPDTASRVLGQESSYGQNTNGDIDPQTGKPTSFGGWQLHRTAGGEALGDQYFRATGVEPGTPGHWQEETKFVLDHVKQVGWGDYLTTMGKLGMNRWSGITRSPAIATTQPQHLSPAATRSATLPIASQPMVAGP